MKHLSRLFISAITCAALSWGTVQASVSISHDTDGSMWAATSVMSDKDQWTKATILRNPTVKEWKSSSASSRLATCGNWVASWWNKKLSVKSYSSMDEIKVDAERLLTAVDLAVSGPGTREDETVAEIATLLAMTLKIAKSHD